MAINLNQSTDSLIKNFTRNVTAREVAEALASFDRGTSTTEILSYMSAKDFDVVGIRDNGTVRGYAKKTDLQVENGALLVTRFLPKEVVPDEVPIADLFKLLQSEARVFVRVFGTIAGIITIADMQKIPIRMWLFGMISLLEMQMQRIIALTYKDDSWKQVLDKPRIDAAIRTFNKESKKNAEIGLVECLSFFDKCVVVFSNQSLSRKLKLDSSIAQCKLKFTALKNLRNVLAHSHKFIAEDWLDFSTRIIEALELLSLAERLK